MGFLQIASWNIEHLGGLPRAERRQSAFALADHIEMSGIDILALQEIYTTELNQEVRLADNQPIIPSKAKDQRRSSYLDIVCYLLEEHLDEPWAYQIVPNRSAGDSSQLCAVMWNEMRVTLAAVEAIAVEHKDGDDKLWDRKPHIFTFTSELNVWRRNDAGEWVEGAEGRRLSLVPLHMKSNYGGVTKNRIVRQKEAMTLCAALKQLQEAGTLDPTLILIGDTNILSNTEPAIDTFVGYGFIDLNNNDATTYWSAQYQDAPFDRAFIAPERPEFQYTRQYVLRSSDLEQHDRLLSDHYMIKISVKDYLDDRDPR